jgi:alpha-beta hydrolase superfamily lysophospholipase
MKKRYYFLISVLALIVVFFTGPRVDESYQIKQFTIDENVEAYIQKSEAMFTDIRPNTEKKIVWFDSKTKQKTDYSIVYLPGYGASRMEISPICDDLAKSLKANLYYSRPAGHGRSDDAMGEATVNDWINDTVESIQIAEKIGKKVIIVGTSTGASLATWFMSNPDLSKNVEASIFISPNFWPYDKSSKIAIYPWGKQIIELVMGKYRSWVPRTEEIRKYWTFRTPIQAIVTLMGTVDLVSRVDVTKIKTPLLIFYSTKDDVIDPKLVEQKFSMFSSENKKLVVVDNSDDINNHVLAGNIMSPSTNKFTLDTMIGFLNTIDK